MDKMKSSKELCPYCRSEAKLDFIIYEGLSFRCKSCDLMFRGAEDAEGLPQHYKDSYFSYYAHDELTGTRNAIYSHALDLIERETAVGKILDVGCGCGFFLKEAKNRGWNITGIDPSQESIAYSKGLLGLSFTHEGTLNDISQENEFDVITMINVMGLSSDPWVDLEKAKALLKEKGLLYFRLPNGIFHSALFRFFIRFKMSYLTKFFLVSHKYSLTPRFIRRLLSDYGFSMVVIQNASFSEGGFINRLLIKAVGITVNSLNFISGGRILAGPSLEVLARKA